VIVFLADGFTNLSDLPPIVDNSYVNGFCQGPETTSTDAAQTHPDGWFMVRPLCSDREILTRYCAETDIAECPPANYGSTTVIHDPPGTQPNYYNVEDYARDWADAAALRVNQGSGSQYNSQEDLGGNAVIYTIALGSGVTFESAQVDDDSASLTAAAAMLRYFAAVGDDGDRVTDACAGFAVTAQCGNYYYAPDATQLSRIFDTIAEKVFFRISQ
jgi:hypothetical protein